MTENATTLRERIEVEFNHWAQQQSLYSARQSPTSDSEDLTPDTAQEKSAIVDLITAAAMEIISMRQRLSDLPLQTSSDANATAADVPSHELERDELHRLVYLYTDLIGYT